RRPETAAGIRDRPPAEMRKREEGLSKQLRVSPSQHEFRYAAFLWESGNEGAALGASVRARSSFEGPLVFLIAASCCGELLLFGLREVRYSRGVVRGLSGQKVRRTGHAAAGGQGAGQNLRAPAGSGRR